MQQEMIGYLKILLKTADKNNPEMVKAITELYKTLFDNGAIPTDPINERKFTPEDSNGVAINDNHLKKHD